MAEARSDDAAAKAAMFFGRADEVAETGNWDFAIELYLEGIRRDPFNIDRGHHPLREVALKRKFQGNKPAGMIEALKRRPGKDPLENLVNAEYLLAKAPASSGNMVAMLKATQAMGDHGLINWTARIILDVLHQGKPNKGMLVQIAQAFDGIEEYDSAIVACRMAQQITPDDPKLVEDIKELSAKAAIKKGGYEEEGDFTKTVKDMDRQKELSREDALVKGKDFLRQQVDRAREEYLQSPNVSGKINVLVDVLLRTGDAGDEHEAIDVLAKAHKDLGAYRFKMRIHEIKIRQMTARYRKLVESGDKSAAIEQAKKQLEFEVEVYADRAANYPTDLGIKFELGKRQFLSGDYDDAIGSLQQAQRDPRRRIEALNYLGQAFARKGWNREATETYERALTSDVAESRKRDIWYNLGDIYEKTGQLDKADAMFSDLAQTDYNYRDVRDRLDQIRKKRQSQDGQ